MGARTGGRGRRVIPFAVVILLAACGSGDPGTPAAGLPNVVLIVMDTTRADRCSVNGYDRPTTPALEALAREGVAYRNAFGPAGWTGPAHASLFTGLVPARHGYLRGVKSFLGEEATTLAERLAALGYRTAAFSNNETVGPEFGLAQGFEHFVPLYEDAERPYPWAPATHLAAVEWAAARHAAGEPFFLFVNDMEAHFPYSPPAKIADRFLPPGALPGALAAARATTIDELFAHNSGARPLPADRLALLSDLYDAEIATLDREIGRLVETFRREGMLDETVFVVTADHGENLGEHGRVDHMFSLHRTIRHVPLVIRYPPAFPAGAVVDELVRLEDVLPTLLDVLGRPPEPGLDGRSLRHDLPGRISTGEMGVMDHFVRRMERDFPLPFDSRPLLLSWQSVTDGRLELLRTSDGVEELYDLAADPQERRDLAGAADRAEELARMRALLPEGNGPAAPAPDEPPGRSPR